MPDEAFMPFAGMIEQMLSFRGEFTDPEAGVRSYVYECEIEAPLELDVSVAPGGKVQIGSTPPLYSERTTFLPAFHQVRIKAEVLEAPDGH